MEGLKDRVSIVTGAARGIGRAHAQRLAREGSKVVVADINEQGARETAEELRRQTGMTAFAVAVDISDAASCHEAVALVLEEYGRIDVLVNNAAIFGGMDMRDTSPEYLDKMIAVNQVGAWKMSREVTPTMREQGRGRIIIQASDAAYMYNIPSLTPDLPNFSYSWTKWALIGLTKMMAGALASSGITVNCIAPGLTLTEAAQGLVGETMRKQLIAQTPMKRAMEADEIAAAMAFLASDEASAITGQVLCVDGGAAMPA
jgi:3-oxoacyl-[acyl-carrier protein] reductase